MVKRNVLALIISLLFSVPAIAAPDQTMSITPTATSGETITASDENSRNNEISTKFNSHSHADVNDLNVNTLTIGDGAVGNKTYAVDTDQANDPGLRYNTSTDMWTLSQDGSTYLAAAHAETTAGLNSGSMLFASGGTVSAAIADAGSASDGQILIGRSGGTPVIGSLSSSGAATITNGSGTITVGTTFATPALTLGTSNSAGAANSLIRSDATVAAFDATVPVTQDFADAAATGSAAIAARRDHRHGMPTPKLVLVESLTLTGTSEVTSATLPTTRDIFMCVFDNARVDGGLLLMRFNSDGSGVYEYTILETTTLTNTTGAAGIRLATTTDAVGSVIFTRPAPTSGNHGVACNLSVSTTALGQTLRGSWGSTAAITTVGFVGSAGGNLSGKVHIYALTDQ